MFKILTSVLFIFFTYQSTSIYTFEVPAANGGVINFSNYQGKRILIVNTATASTLISQLSALQQLQDTHGSSLVVVAFPSNSFGSEPLSDTAIQSLLTGTYGITFPIAAKVNVTDSTGAIAPIYSWLFNRDQNGVMKIKVRGNFNKYLINKQGVLVGYFDSTITPLSQTMQNALQSHQ